MNQNAPADDDGLHKTSIQEDRILSSITRRRNSGGGRRSSEKTIDKHEWQLRVAKKARGS